MATVLSNGSDFSQALATWREVCPASHNSTREIKFMLNFLDTSGLEIVENQKNSVMGRKKIGRTN
ncbi:hypothetical protein PSHT_01631 [Puccinia striiformis]|uniref:Uncharacterized protein n=1 Tax=Puccinia striiformis TaxID=27350 RepID=A0A2S4WJW3_9BASI|nr:hypothetical protein PSHT_01631 [Puccinia striiformis]